jgi:predicted MPP superfamily phosphohydrolase
MVRAMNLSGSVPTFKPTPFPGSLPAPLECVEVMHPDLPEGLDGLTVLHLTDLHLRAGKPWSPWLETLANAVSSVKVDLAIFTGDAMNYPGDEDSAAEGTGRLLRACSARHGVFGIFGNHDSPLFRDRVVNEFETVRWLRDDVIELPGMPIRLIGPEDPEDLVHTLLKNGDGSRGAELGKFDIALVHYPTEIYPVAAFGIPLAFAGHTHGGQIRLSPEIAPHTSSDLPGWLACGVLRYRKTLCCVPRGLGEAVIEVRVNCRRQAPVYVLRKGPFAGPPVDEHSPRLTRIVRW